MPHYALVSRYYQGPIYPKRGDGCHKEELFTAEDTEAALRHVDSLPWFRGYRGHEEHREDGEDYRADFELYGPNGKIPLP